MRQTENNQLINNFVKDGDERLDTRRGREEWKEEQMDKEGDARR